jgi:hypothetical protein
MKLHSELIRAIQPQTDAEIKALREKILSMDRVTWIEVIDHHAWICSKMNFVSTEKYIALCPDTFIPFHGRVDGNTDRTNAIVIISSDE